MKFYRKSNYLKLLLGACLIFLGRYILVRFFVLDGDIKNPPLCQLYFGGIFISDSFDLIMVSLYMAIISISVILVNEEIMTGLFDNLEIILCRTTKKSKIFKEIVRMFLFNTLFITILNYIMFLAVEGHRPSVVDTKILLSEIILILLLDFIYLIIRCLSRNDLAYIGVLIVYFVPILFTGFLYVKGENGWVNGKCFLTNNFIYNYMHEIEFFYQTNDYSFVTPVLNLGISSSIVEIILKFLVLLILFIIAKRSFLKHSII